MGRTVTNWPRALRFWTIGVSSPSSDEEVIRVSTSSRSTAQYPVIINYILNGAIMRAIETLNTHFPSVLTEPSTASSSNGHSDSSASAPNPIYLVQSAKDRYPSTPHSIPTYPSSLKPAHILLNLQIQAFLETFREMRPPSAPPSPSSSMSSINSSMIGSTTLTHALTAAQELQAAAAKLPSEERAVYLGEINSAGALFAYQNPEEGPLRGFLEQSRRIALADQVNRAVLRECRRSRRAGLD